MSRIRILVIDDEPTARVLIEAMLTHAGYEVTTAADGNEGLGLYERIRPSVVITDILMPQKDGIETILELRRTDNAAKIIAISGGGSGSMGGRELLRLAHGLGATSTLEKRDLAHQLLNRLEDILNGDEQPERLRA